VVKIVNDTSSDVSDWPACTCGGLNVFHRRSILWIQVSHGSWTWRALRVFVPLDLLFRLFLWVGYPHSLGSLDQEAHVRLALIAGLAVVPFLAAWIAGLVCLPTPIVGRRLQADSPSHPRAGDDGCAAPRRDPRAVIGAPRRVSRRSRSALAPRRARSAGVPGRRSPASPPGLTSRSWPAPTWSPGQRHAMAALCLGVGPTFRPEPPASPHVVGTAGEEQSAS
jgi:hypothetical protein